MSSAKGIVLEQCPTISKLQNGGRQDHEMPLTKLHGQRFDNAASYTDLKSISADLK